MEFIGQIMYSWASGDIARRAPEGAACRMMVEWVENVSSGDGGVDAAPSGRTVRVVAFDPDVPADAAAIRALARVDLSKGPDGTWSAGRLMSAFHDPSRAVSQLFSGERLSEALVRPAPADFLAFAHVGARDAVPTAMFDGTPVIITLTAAERIWCSVPTPALRTAWLGGSADGSTPRAGAGARAAFLSDLLLDLLTYATPDEIHWLSRDPG